MSNTPQSFAELDGLLDRLAVGTLDEPGHLRLDELVGGGLEVRRRYIERMFLMADLRCRLNQAVAPTVTLVRLSRFFPQHRPGALRQYAPRFASRRMLAWSVAGCAMAFAAYVAVISWGMLDGKAQGARDEARGASGSQDSDLAPRASHLAPAQVVASENALWQKQPQAGPPAASAANQPFIAEGEPLELASGVVELKLKQGVTLQIEGPAAWAIDGENSATLTRGKLLASVPTEAIGFSVKTPTATVVDLGTEFGVTVDEHGGTRTRVFKGEVKLHASPSAEAQALPAQRLTAGQAVRIGTDGIVSPIQVEFATADEFIRRPGSKSSHVLQAATEPSHAYSRAVLATPGLLGYWRMGEDGTQGARDEVGVSKDRPLGRSSGLLARFFKADYRQPGALSGKDNYAIHFGGESYIEAADDPNLNGDWDGLTLAAWIKPERQQPASAGPTSLIVGKWAYEVTGDAYALFYDRSGKLQFAVGNGANGENGLVGAGNVPVTSDAYHFVVGTWEKATGDYRLYVDGQADSAQGQQKAPHKVNAKGYVPVLIGGQRANNSRYFAGCIDEVSIFNRALTADEVGQLYRLAIDQHENEETKAEPGRVRSE